MLRGIASFVWQDDPGQDADAVTTWLVKAANGNGTVGNGHDFAKSYAAWAKHVGPEHTHAWTWLYHTTDGRRAADMLVGSAPHAAGYGIDVEGDDPGVAVSLDLEQLAPVVRAFYRRIRELRPGVDVWFTSYPDRWQATSHGAPWQELIAGADYGIPQIYFSSQGARWDGIVADHGGKPVIAAFSPGDWAQGWTTLATTALRRFGGVAIWRYPDTRAHAQQLSTLAHLTPTTEDDVTPQEIQDAVLAALNTDQGQQLLAKANQRVAPQQLQQAVLAALQTDEGQHLLGKAVHNFELTDPSDGVKKRYRDIFYGSNWRTWSVRQMLHTVATRVGAQAGGSVSTEQLQTALVGALQELANQQDHH
jgi:hypothetical protein